MFLCEHPHVYTLGKSGKSSNLLASNAVLDSIGAEFIRVERGGDITYHGPGQLVCYPVLNLDSLHLGIRDYVYLLEESIIELIEEFEIEGSTIHGATGVWLEAGSEKKRKICSIGIKESRKITMHGLALNVNTNLDYFQYINPCGYTAEVMTSMQKEKNKIFDVNLLKNRLIDLLKKRFGN